MREKKIGKYLTRTFLVLITVMLLAALLIPCSTMYKRNYAIPILEYHNIATGSSNPEETWTVSLSDFQDQMAYLSQQYHVIPLRDMLAMIKQGTTIPDKTIAVSFDDGYRSNYLLAYPVIAKYRIPCTIFVVVKFIETGKVGNDPALQWDDMKTMYSSGLVDIQSHSYDLHRLVPSGKTAKMEPAILAQMASGQGLETDAQRDQRIENDLTKSRQEIEQKLGNKVDTLCWPFGAFDQHDTDLAKKAGYEYMTGNVRYSNPKTSINDIGRVVVPAGMTLNDFKELVHPAKITYLQALQMDWARLQYFARHLISR